MEGGDAQKEWLASCTRLLLIGAMRASRTADLYHLVVRRAAQGTLASPAALAPPSADPAFGRLFEALFLRMVQFVCRGSDQTLPLDSQPHELLNGLSAYVTREMTRGFAENAAGAEETVTRFGRLFFELLEEWMKTAAAGQEAHLRSLLVPPHLLPSTGPVIQLCAKSGTVASAEMSVENTRAQRTVISCVASNVRRADGIGPAVPPGLDIQPHEFDLEPRETANIRLTMTLDGGLYEPGTLYVGLVNVTCADEPAVGIPLRIVASTSLSP